MNPEDRLRQMLGKARGDDNVTSSKWDEFATSARRSLRVQRFAAAGVAVVLLAGVAVGAATAFNGSDPDRNFAPVGPTTPEIISTPTAAPPTPDTSPTSDPTDVPVEAHSVNETEIWMVANDGSSLSWGWTFIDPEAGHLETAIHHLLAGAIGVYAEVGETSAIPSGAELIGIEHGGEVARINLSQGFLGGDDSDKSMRLRVAQIVFTATAIEGVNEVEILVEDAPLRDGVLQRSDFGDISPPIVVESPKIASEHSSPLIVSGTANVFEANVSMELVIGSGKNADTIETFTTATCGSGCRGDFSTEIEFNIDKPTGARLHVFEVSAEDGSRLYEVILPVRLLPS
jgi:Immunoglobulin-like domain of bacterial spore germination/Sporulation and spore germination